MKKETANIDTENKIEDVNMTAQPSDSPGTNEPETSKKSADATGKSSQEGRSWYGVVGMVAAVALWLAVFLMPETSFTGLIVQGWIMVALSVVTLLLCIKGLKSEPGISKVGIVVSGALLLFLLIGLIGSHFIDSMAS